MEWKEDRFWSQMWISVLVPPLTIWVAVCKLWASPDLKCNMRTTNTHHYQIFMMIQGSDNTQLPAHPCAHNG